MKARAQINSQIIANRNVSKEDLRLAIGAMGAWSNHPSFWSSIANSKDYTAEHRRLSVFQLFKRHVRAGQRLFDLAEILDRPTWLQEENITLIESFHGKVPVVWDLVNSIFAIRLGLPAENNSAVYLKLTGKQIDAKSFFRLLKAKSFDQKQGDIEILEVGYSEID